MRHEIIDIAKFIHANPELGNQEFKAVELLTKTLADNGFVIEKGVAGLRRPSSPPTPTLAAAPPSRLWPNMTPWKAWATAAGTTSSRPHAPARRSPGQEPGDTPATVIVFGCPAEETTSGKIPMAAEGLFNRADVGFQMHPGANGIGSYTLALNLMDFTFTGKASHAASAPWEGRSALDGIMMLFNGIEYLREHVKPDVRIHGIVTDGGQAANIVPETASARFYVRSEERSYLDTVVKRVHAIAEAAAIATETQLTITPIKQYDNVVNVPGFMKLVQDVAKDYVGLDMPFATPGGAAASTDFGTASSSIPCVMFGLSPVPEGTVPVTPARWSKR